MNNGFFQPPIPQNEPVKQYAPNTPDRQLLQDAIKEWRSKEVDIPMYIGGKEVRSGKKVRIAPPHDHQHTLGYFHKSSKEHIQQAIDAALAAKPQWEALSWEQRASIFLKAADLIAHKYRYKLNAATMLGQSKNPFQAEIDSACELIDFLRFNVYYMSEIYKEQPNSAPGMLNRMIWRPLEGFVYALTPFNFTAIAGNLPTSAAMMGNVVVWKPSNDQVYSAHVIMEILKEAGLPDGVINLIYPSGSEAADVIFSNYWFAGIHFTGSTEVFQSIWKQIGNNIHLYRSYPRIVGETGGKDFVIAHPSADAKSVAVALSRGAFEYQGQKCSAASRAYIPKSLWKEVQQYLGEDLSSMKMGGVEDFSNFINAVINEDSFNKLSQHIENAKKSKDVQIIFGGKYDKSVGYFIEPTVIQVFNPTYYTMCNELFGPILSIYVYEDKDYEEMLDVVNNTGIYALTGAVFANDRYAIDLACKKLINSAGNFYINDKPTGAVVGQQPFGGARASGTNDKAGSKLNLYRWVSPQTIKETWVPPIDYRYPFLG
ncbi:MAG: L-glutamate gamma-semialdehyde dehydrogenase [Bacteroidota bacterium]